MTLDAANHFKKAAEMTEDENLLLEITEVDLVAKEFKSHGKCYHDYTRVLYATKSKTPVNEKGNFEDVCRLIKDDVIASQKCVSMNVLINVYGIGKDQHQYRQYLKARLERHFDEIIYFITVEYHEVQIVISTECIHEKTLSSYIELSDNRILLLTARTIRKSVDEMIKKSSHLSWPPSVDELESKSREPLEDLFEHIAD